MSGVVTSTLRVGLTEWSIETGGAVPAAGELTVLVTNTGATGHDLVVHGEQGTWQTPVLAAGERHELTVTAVPGETLELVCSVSGHHAAGMSAELDVAEDR
jgi:plastocyanin